MVERVDVYIENLNSQILDLVTLGYLDLTVKNITPEMNLDPLLIRTCSSGHLEILQVLLDRGVNIHTQNDLALHMASVYNHLEVVQLLLDRGADIHTDIDYTFRRACEENHLEAVRILFQHGAQPDTHDNFSLRQASHYGYLEIVRFLLDYEPCSPIYRSLVLASINGHWQVVQLLLDKGIPPQAWYLAQKEALSAARSNGQTEVINLLLDRGIS